MKLRGCASDTAIDQIASDILKIPVTIQFFTFFPIKAPPFIIHHGESGQQPICSLYREQS